MHCDLFVFVRLMLTNWDMEELELGYGGIVEKGDFRVSTNQRHKIIQRRNTLLHMSITSSQHSNT